MKGYVETISRAQVRGWAFDSEDPQRRVEVELVVDGRSVATAPANVERADLTVVGAGRTDLGFVIEVPAGVPLNIARTSIRLAGGKASLPVTREAAALEGVVDHFDSTGFGGWAWQAGCPEERVWLSILHDGEQVARLQADLEWSDLVRAGVGDGRHGFMVDLAALPGRVRQSPEQIEVAFEATGRKLHDLRGLTEEPAPAAPHPAVEELQEAPHPLAARAAAPTGPTVSQEVLDALRGSLSLGDEDKELSF